MKGKGAQNTRFDRALKQIEKRIRSSKESVGMFKGAEWRWGNIQKGKKHR